MISKYSWLCFTFLPVFFLFSGCADKELPAPQGGRGGFSFPVEVGKPTIKDVSDQLKVVGNIQSEFNLNIAAEVNARVLSIEVKEGSRFKEGQLLARLDSEQYELEVARLESEVKSAALELEKARAGLRPEVQNSIQAQLDSAKSQLTLAVRDFEKQQALYQEKIISRNEMDSVNDRMDRAKARVKSIQAELDSSKVSRSEEIFQLEQALSAKQKELEMAQLNLSKTSIHAPMNGVVVEKLTREGSFVESGTGLLKISGADQMVVVLNVPQSYRNKLSNVRSIEVLIQESKKSFTLNTELKRRIKPIPFGDISTGSMFVLVGISDKSQGLFPGMTLEATLNFKKRKRILHVPSVSLVISEMGTAVYKFTDGKAQLVPVKAFREKNNMVEIIDFTHQLKPESLLIVKGSGAVFPGAGVFPTNMPPPPGKSSKAAS